MLVSWDPPPRNATDGQARYGFRDNESLSTTKASFEFATMVFGTRMNLINYTEFKSNQIAFLPEFGLSYSGIFSIMYMATTYF